MAGTATLIHRIASVVELILSGNQERYAVTYTKTLDGGQVAFLCLDPAVLFSQVAEAADSLILMSGTLSPGLPSLGCELGVTFSVQMEATTHVVSQPQVRRPACSVIFEAIIMVVCDMCGCLRRSGGLGDCA